MTESEATRLRRWFPARTPSGLRPFEAELAIAARAVVRGGEAAMRLYRLGSLAVTDKAVDDPVTEADHASNEQILDCLRLHRPFDPVVSEEVPAPPASSAKRLWLVDPLDGTKEFIAANGEFSVMVGLAIDGWAALGAVFQPDLDLLFLGVADVGAYVVEGASKDGRARPLRIEGRPVERLRLVRSRSHPDPRLRSLEESLGEVDTVRSGSVGIKCALIALGRADLYVHPVPHLKEWDTCAPEAILRGAGGRVTDCLGRPLSYAKADPRQPGGIFAAREDVWHRVAHLVATVAP
ncbi:MAG: 3'(2'),5'-bisphosphate nucleotidase CysQ [Gemmatimonadota bacterium]